MEWQHNTPLSISTFISVCTSITVTYWSFLSIKESIKLFLCAINKLRPSLYNSNEMVAEDLESSGWAWRFDDSIDLSFAAAASYSSEILWEYLIEPFLANEIHANQRTEYLNDWFMFFERLTCHCCYFYWGFTSLVYNFIIPGVWSFPSTVILLLGRGKHINLTLGTLNKLKLLTEVESQYQSTILCAQVHQPPNHYIYIDIILGYRPHY